MIDIFITVSSLNINEVGLIEIRRHNSFYKILIGFVNVKQISISNIYIYKITISIQF